MMKNELLEKLNQAKAVYEESDDESLKLLAKEDIVNISKQLDDEDELNQGNAIIEIRAGSGGDEAELFAGELFRMYQKYIENKGWKVELADSNMSDLKGIKSLTIFVKGHGAYGALRFEGGVHRVQRVPKTEKNGRIHTSAASVAVLPELKNNSGIEIKPTDIRVDVYRASGHGGQGVNTTDSAVRITHLATNIVVTCQDERSQLKNKDKAMNVLRGKLWELKQSQQAEETGDLRKNMIKSGDRSDKIRTYNFPQNRVTDHRINKSYFGIESIMGGNIDDIVSDLKAANLGLNDD